MVGRDYHFSGLSGTVPCTVEKFHSFFQCRNKKEVIFQKVHPPVELFCKITLKKYKKMFIVLCFKYS